VNTHPEFLMRTRYPLTKNQILFENKDIFLKLLVVFVPLALLAFLIYGNMQSWKSARKLSRQLTLNQSAAVAEELALCIYVFTGRSFIC